MVCTIFEFCKRVFKLFLLCVTGSMSFCELIQLLQRLNCRADIRYAERLFEQFDEDGSSLLEFDEFRRVGSMSLFVTYEDCYLRVFVCVYSSLFKHF